MRGTEGETRAPRYRSLGSGTRGARVRMSSGCSGPQLGPGVPSPRPSQPLGIPPTGASLRAGARPGLAGGFGGAHAPRPRPRPQPARSRGPPRARAPRRRSPRPSPPARPRPRPGTLAGPERERRRHLSRRRRLQRSASSAEGRAPAAAARGPASRRRLLRGPQRSPRRPAAGPGPPELRAAPRAPPCRSRLGPAAAPGARAMPRRAAPALAPAAWLLVAGLLCGRGVWAARGKRRGRGGARGSEPGRGGRGPGARAAGAAGRQAPFRARHLGPGRPPRGSVAAARVWGTCRRAEGSVHAPRQRPQAGAAAPGETPRSRAVCAEVQRAGGAGWGCAQVLVCAYISAPSSASLCETRVSAAAPRLRPCPPPRALSAAAETSAPLPPLSPKVRL